MFANQGRLQAAFENYDPEKTGKSFDELVFLARIACFFSWPSFP